MSNKITMYELLGLVKDGQAPKRIKYQDKVYYYYSNLVDLHKYKTMPTENRRSLSLILDNEYLNLNDEVEILDNEDEEKKIPEKLPYYSLEKIQKAKSKDEWCEERISLLEKRVEDLHIKMNELLDYLKSKGE